MYMCFIIYIYSFKNITWQFISTLYYIIDNRKKRLLINNNPRIVGYYMRNFFFENVTDISDYNSTANS